MFGKFIPAEGHESPNFREGGICLYSFVKRTYLMVIVALGLLWASAAPAEINDVPWETHTPGIKETLSAGTMKVEPLPEGEAGIKMEVKAGFYDWWTWNVEDAFDSRANNWQFRAEIERLEGGAGVIFGRINQGIILAAYLNGDKLTLIEYSRSGRGSTKILKEASLEPQHQKGPVVMFVSVQRDAKIIRCSIGDTEYINVDLTEKIRSMPAIEGFGFFCGAYEFNGVSSAVFRKIETRLSRN